MPVDKKDTDLENRVRKLLEKEKPIENTSEQDLIQRFNHVFSTQPVVAQSKPNYAIPDNAYSDEIDKQIEAMLNESDDDDIYDMLDSKQDRQLYCSLNDNIDHLQETFLGKETYNTDESHELIQRVQQEAALDHRYDQFTQQRDKALEQRYLDLKKNAPNVSTTSNSTKPKGIIPKPLGKDDLHDEMNDWCCICNDDATIECLGCEDDNTYCKPCFVYTHLSEAADYEATKHKSRPYVR
ncbi:uncharacterized protein B0P05DRAFT_557793 [Gilbertella persicaria]|uniref:uncharacterized protein n=1 Tax=Gilbertella persicaria TaxID=101096 RepID=UPI0022205039|nr:uncharacterized protein B0P05DRAFT_557793 [Gilbertella persicaria]KAI8060672.1 hypothetical protein B0P05DRAFT_557793 [Gilbertella persicaria]